jgi:chromatin remodeling complex protein RSC6
MGECREHARPRLKTVNDAIGELWDYIKDHIDEQSLEEHKKDWDDILDKHDINYNNLKRWVK